MTTLLTEQKIGKTMAQIDAALKKFEAIKADIQPRVRFHTQIHVVIFEFFAEDFLIF